MTSDQYSRDFTDPNVRRPGRIDLELFQDIDACFDGYPGLQRAMKNWAKHWLHDGVMDQDLDLNNQGINDVESIDGGGDAIIINDDLDLAGNAITTSVGDNISFDNNGLNNIDNFDERVYFVSTDAELDNAIQDITDNQCAGRIIITESMSNVQKTINGANSSFIIEGNGNEVVLDANGDNNVFYITNCLSCIIRDLKIDASDLTTALKGAIRCDEGSDNPCYFERIEIVGDTTNCTGIDGDSDNVFVSECVFNDLEYGTLLSGSYSIISNCLALNCGYGFYSSGDYSNIVGSIAHDCSYGIYVSATCITISGNSLYNNNWNIKTGGTNIAVVGNACNGGAYGIQSYAGESTVTGNSCSNQTIYGIQLGSSSDESTVTGNNCYNCTTDGIFIGNGCDECTIVGNTCRDGLTNNGANNVVANNNDA